MPINQPLRKKQLLPRYALGVPDLTQPSAYYFYYLFFLLPRPCTSPSPFLRNSLPKTLLASPLLWLALILFCTRFLFPFSCGFIGWKVNGGRILFCEAGWKENNAKIFLLDFFLIFSLMGISPQRDLDPVTCLGVL